VRAHVVLTAALDYAGDGKGALEAAQEILKHPAAGLAVSAGLHTYCTALARNGTVADLEKAIELLPGLRRRLKEKSHQMHRAKVSWLQGAIHRRLVREGIRPIYNARQTQKNLDWARQGFLSLKAQPEIALITIEMIELSSTPEIVAATFVGMVIEAIEPASPLWAPFKKLERAASSGIRDRILTATRELRDVAERDAWCPAV
jgi:hypothetical protein